MSRKPDLKAHAEIAQHLLDKLFDNVEDMDQFRYDPVIILQMIKTLLNSTDTGVSDDDDDDHDYDYEHEAKIETKRSKSKSKAQPRARKLPPVTEKDKVTLKQIKEFARKKGDGFVVFYAKWCGHCHDLMTDLGAKGVEHGKKFVVDNYSAPDNVLFLEADYVPKKALTDLKIGGFPTVLAFNNGQLSLDSDGVRQMLLDEYESAGYEPLRAYEVSE